MKSSVLCLLFLFPLLTFGQDKDTLMGFEGCVGASAVDTWMTAGDTTSKWNNTWTTFYTLEKDTIYVASYEGATHGFRLAKFNFAPNPFMMMQPMRPMEFQPKEQYSDKRDPDIDAYNERVMKKNEEMMRKYDEQLEKQMKMRDSVMLYNAKRLEDREGREALERKITKQLLPDSAKDTIDERWVQVDVAIDINNLIEIEYAITNKTEFETRTYYFSIRGILEENLKKYITLLKGLRFAC